MIPDSPARRSDAWPGFSLCLAGQPPGDVLALAAAPGSRRSLIGMALGAVQARARKQGRTSRLAAAAQEHVMTFAACSAATSAAFIHGPTWGLGFLAGSFLLLDFKIQG